MTILYKDKECTIEAVCPLSFHSIGSDWKLWCATECAWCRKENARVQKYGSCGWYEEELPDYFSFYCGAVYSARIPLYAKEEGDA